METEKDLLRRGREAEPSGAESRESKESREAGKETEVDPEARAAAVMERADVIVKEVKTSKKQIQNIFLNMQSVQAAIKQLRAQLQLRDDDAAGQGSGTVHHSTASDQKRIEELKKKIAGHKKELEAMKQDLVRYQKEDLEKQNLGLSAAELQAKAQQMVDSMIVSIEG